MPIDPANCSPHLQPREVREALEEHESLAKLFEKVFDPQSAQDKFVFDKLEKMKVKAIKQAESDFLRRPELEKQKRKEEEEDRRRAEANRAIYAPLLKYREIREVVEEHERFATLHETIFKPQSVQGKLFSNIVENMKMDAIKQAENDLMRRLNPGNLKRNEEEEELRRVEANKAIHAPILQHREVREAVEEHERLAKHFENLLDPQSIHDKFIFILLERRRVKAIERGEREFMKRLGAEKPKEKEEKEGRRRARARENALHIKIAQELREDKRKFWAAQGKIIALPSEWREIVRYTNANRLCKREGGKRCLVNVKKGKVIPQLVKLPPRPFQLYAMEVGGVLNDQRPQIIAKYKKYYEELKEEQNVQFEKGWITFTKETPVTIEPSEEE